MSLILLAVEVVALAAIVAGVVLVYMPAGLVVGGVLTILAVERIQRVVRP